MQLENVLETNLSNKLVNQNEQNNFLETTIGKVINIGIDTGLRALLPDLIENQIINIKDEIIKNGFSSGIKEAVSSAIDLGKSAIGMITGNFENINQARTVIKSGGLIDSISSLLDKGINYLSKNKKISSNISSIIKSGKNVILDTINNNIEANFDNQISSIEKISKYSANWKEYYQNKDFLGMEKEYKKIKEKLKEIMPIEKTITEARQIENIHTLIKNKDGKFDLSKEELELANKLIYNE